MPPPDPALERASPAAPRTSRRLVGAVLAVLRFALALAVALVVVELVLRALGLGLPPRGPDNNLPLRRSVPEREAPGLFDTLKPQSQGKVLYPGWKDLPDRWVQYRINPDGFRDRRYERPKPAAAFRIALLGDSVTYGTGVDMADALPKQLEKLFAEHAPESPEADGAPVTVEVMNCGVYAHNTRQQIAWLEYAVLAFEPDLVVVVSTITDASGRGVPPAPHDYGWEQRWIERLGLTSGVWDPGTERNRTQAFTMFLRRHSRLADLFAHRAWGFLRGRLMGHSYRADWQVGSPGYELVHDALARARDLAREHGFELVDVMYPTLTTLNSSYPFVAETQALAGICAELGIPFLNPFEAVAGRDAKSLHAHAHDRHPNAIAHGLVAQWLYPRLLPFVAGSTPR